jgi:hypothetical protein
MRSRTPGTLAADRERRHHVQEIEQFRRQLDRVVADVARENHGRIHPDLLRMPMVALALSNAALRSVGAEQLRAFLTFAVRAGLQPGRTVEADIVPHPETGALELRPRLGFADLEDAEQMRLPGDAAAFDGCGGQPISVCSTALLRGVLAWIAAPHRPNRPVTYARLHAAITTVLAARTTAVAPQETA